MKTAILPIIAAIVLIACGDAQSACDINGSDLPPITASASASGDYDCPPGYPGCGNLPGGSVGATMPSAADVCIDPQRLYYFICYASAEIEGIRYPDYSAGVFITINSVSAAEATFESWFDSAPDGPAETARARGKTAWRVGLTYCKKSHL